MTSHLDTVLVTGGTGFLGAACTEIPAARSVERRQLDLESLTSAAGKSQRTAEAQFVELLETADGVLHTAAMSSMGACEADPELADRINHQATARLAEITRRLNKTFLFVSTDLVFDGLSAPYRSTDSPTPLSVYGKTKARAESAVLAAGGTVARIPLLFGKSSIGGRGATAMLRGSQNVGISQPLHLFTNEFRTPLHVQDAASQLVHLTQALRSRNNRPGIVHLAGPERISRLEFGQRFQQLHPELNLDLKGVQSSDPKRPQDVSLEAGPDPWLKQTLDQFDLSLPTLDERLLES